MADVHDKKTRSYNMSRIGSRDTKPEVMVRKFLHANGYRYSLHRANLPGKPDITLRKYRSAVFVNGCYWHRHEGCRYSYQPKTNTDFWMKKFAENVARDKRNYAQLEELGWRVIIVWECEVKADTYQSKLIGLLKE